MKKICTLAIALFAALGCSDSESSDATTLAEQLGVEFEVGEGAAVTFRVEDCEELPDCFATNASSPYLLFGLPPSPGAGMPPIGSTLGVVPRLSSDLTPTWHLDSDEAIVIAGSMPPPAAYFSLAPYLFDRADGTGGRSVIFASLFDATNHVHFAENGTGFAEPFVVVLTPDAGVAGRVVEAIARAEPSATPLVIPIPPGPLRLGSDAEADGVGVLGRVALFDDEEQGETWLSEVETEWEVLRLSPVGTFDSEPFEVGPRQSRALGNSESPLTEALDALGESIRDEYGEASVEPVPITSARLIAALLRPEGCIEQGRNCLGDNGDTVYAAGPVSPAGEVLPLEFPDEGFFVVFGVDHEATGNATYANAVLNLAEKRAGVAASDSRSWTDSAARYLPDHPDQSQLFAWHFARSCDGLENCTEVPRTFPGVPDDGNVLFVFRAYLNPNSTVSTDPSFMVPERAVWVAR